MTVLAAIPFFALASHAASQQSTLTGVVLDATSGQPVNGALVTVEILIGNRGPRAIANPQGRFSLANVPQGSREIRVERFGYQTLQVTVDVTAAPAPLELRMQVSPLTLDEITVTGGVKASLTGSVMDNRSGQPIPFVDVSLMRDINHENRNVSGDDRGIFEMSGVVTGNYLLRVERLGYIGQYIPMTHAAPPEPLEIRLDPDPSYMAGVAVMTGELRNRRFSHGGDSRGFEEQLLRTSLAPGMRQFLRQDGYMPVVPCDPRDSNENCFVIRGQVTSPRLYVDEAQVFGLPLDYLDGYRPQDIYQVDFFVCGSTPTTFQMSSSVTTEIRVYTYEYMRRMGRKPKMVIPACFP